MRLKTLINIHPHGQNIKQVDQFTYLGVVLDKHLNWKVHVEEMSINIGTRLKILSRIRAYLTLEAAKAGCSQELQRLQNQAAHLVLKRSSSVNKAKANIFRLLGVLQVLPLF